MSDHLSLPCSGSGVADIPERGVYHEASIAFDSERIRALERNRNRRRVGPDPHNEFIFRPVRCRSVDEVDAIVETLVLNLLVAAHICVPLDLRFADEEVSSVWYFDVPAGDDRIRSLERESDQDATREGAAHPDTRRIYERGRRRARRPCHQAPENRALCKARREPRR